jgi:hypothetical protein
MSENRNISDKVIYNNHRQKITNHGGEIMTYEKKPLEGAQTSTAAIISLILGILSVISLILFCLPCTRLFSLIFGLVAAILGFISLRKIKNAQGAMTGRGMAIGSV